MTTYTAGKIKASLKWPSGNPRSHPALLDDDLQIVAELSSIRPTTEQDAEHLALCWNTHEPLLSIVRECRKLPSLPLAVQESIDAVLSDIEAMHSVP